MRVTPAHRMLGHRRAVRCDPVTVKRRLHESTPTSVRLALGAEEPVSDDPLPGLERQTGELPVMRNEHVLHVVGVIEQEEMSRSEAEVHDVAVLAGGGGEVAERVAPERQKRSTWEPAPWAWGVLRHRSPSSGFGERAAVGVHSTSPENLRDVPFRNHTARGQAAPARPCRRSVRVGRVCLTPNVRPVRSPCLVRRPDSWLAISSWERCPREHGLASWQALSLRALVGCWTPRGIVGGSYETS